VAELKGPAVLKHESLQGLDLTSSPTNHVLHVGRTFALSYERLDRATTVDTLALMLLARAAHFAPGVPIPHDLLLPTLNQPDRGLDAARALRRLLDLGLLTETTNVTSTLHRLMVQFVGDSSNDPAAESDVAQVLLTRADELNAQAQPATLLTLQPHLRAVTDARQAKNDALSAALCNALGLHLRMVADYSCAKLYLERALAVRKKLRGRPLDRAQSLQNLGDLLEAQGEYKKARPLLQFLKKPTSRGCSEQVAKQAPDFSRQCGQTAKLPGASAHRRRSGRHPVRARATISWRVSYSGDLRCCTLSSLPR
jgi:hypothetical protein